jgi:hypothetical protein
MNTISDNDLILYFYRDGLEPERVAAIDAALRESATLRARLDALRAMLGAVDAEAAPQPDAGFDGRVWRRLEARIERELPRRRHGWREHLHEWLLALAAPRLAVAATALLAVAVGIGYLAGRSGSTPAPATATAGGSDGAMAARVLDAYVADHLRATEGLLLTAANSDSDPLHAGNREVAETLVESNRLYAAAAARAGNTRLADFLRQLEPVLIDLANQPADAPVESREGLREYLRKTDLLFQVRATQARIETPGRHKT